MGVPTQGAGTTTSWTADGSGYDAGPYDLPNDGSQWSFATVMVLIARIINSLGGLYSGSSSQVAAYSGTMWTIAAGNLSTFLHALADKAAKLDGNNAFTGTCTFGPQATFTTGLAGGDVSAATGEIAALWATGTLRCGTAPDLAGGGTGCVAIRNAGTAPSGTPANGGVLYVSAGALVYKGSSGTVTTIANA
jgi:hypothetical protein